MHTPNSPRPSGTKEPIITAIVVTYNRERLLRTCVAALQAQTFPLRNIIIVNNASTDGTVTYLSGLTASDSDHIATLNLTENSGGAGGFSIGMNHAIKSGSDWIWMMDDDAEPRPDALAELMRIADNPNNVYGSLATNGNETSWMITMLGNPPKTTGAISDVPIAAKVQMLPFLGFMIHRKLVAKIGLPDAGFFIAADDVEYCIRAQRVGAQIIVAGKSHIKHPKSRPYQIRLLGVTLTCLELPPWKRYYDTRNRLLIARKHYGLRLLTQTIPGSFVRLFATLVKEPRKATQLKAFFAGFVDGILGIKGKRHETWGIN